MRDQAAKTAQDQARLAQAQASSAFQSMYEHTSKVAQDQVTAAQAQALSAFQAACDHTTKAANDQFMAAQAQVYNAFQAPSSSQAADHVLVAKSDWARLGQVCLERVELQKDMWQTHAQSEALRVALDLERNCSKDLKCAYDFVAAKVAALEGDLRRALGANQSLHVFPAANYTVSQSPAFNPTFSSAQAAALGTSPLGTCSM